MKRLKLFILLFLCFSSMKVYASQITVNPTSLSIQKGNIVAFKITAENCAGRVDVSTSDNSIASVNKTSIFLDNSTETIIVTGVNDGNATLTVQITDVTDYDLKPVTGTKSVPVYVYSINPSTNNDSKQEQISSQGEQAPPEEKKEDLFNISKFEVVGYNLAFEESKEEYYMIIDEKVDKLYVIVEGEGITVEGDKEVNIKDKKDFTVTISNGTIKKDYKITLNRERKEESYPKKKEEKKDNDFAFQITFALLVILILSNIIYFFVKSKKKKSHIIKDEEVL